MAETKMDMLILPESGKLDGKNYPIWKFKLKNILKLTDLWDITERKVARPQVDRAVVRPEMSSQERAREEERYEEEVNERD